MAFLQLKIPWSVGGFDYYTRTVFEIVAEGLGAQDAVGGGGRYNNLVQDLGDHLCQQWVLLLG